MIFKKGMNNLQFSDKFQSSSNVAAVQFHRNEKVVVKLTPKVLLGLIFIFEILKF